MNNKPCESIFPRVRAVMAPFETFPEHTAREESGAPYNDAFIKRCREKALEYDKGDNVLRVGLLQDLVPCVPRHYRSMVFEGIADFGYKGEVIQ